MLNRLEREKRLYLSVDTVVCDNKEEQNYSLEFINSLTPSGLLEHKLYLKVGCIIILLRNLYLRNGLCNGIRLIVRHLHNHVINAEVIAKQSHQRVLIPRVKLAPSDVNLPFRLERRQFSIRLAYSMTINKLQGQTFSKVGIYLPAPVFTLENCTLPFLEQEH